MNDSIYVNPFEFSILKCIEDKPKRTEQIVTAINKSPNLIESRLYYFITQNIVSKEEVNRKMVYKLMINAERLVIRDSKQVTAFRCVHRGAKYTPNSLSDQTKDQIGVLVKQGLRRTQIAKQLNISKSELLMVMVERNYESFLSKKMDKIDSHQQNPSWINNNLLDQFREAYAIAKKMKESNRTYAEIHEHLFKHGYCNLSGNPLTIPNLMNFFGKNMPKCLLGDQYADAN